MIDVTEFLGIQWAHGTADCYSLPQAFYKKHFDLDMADYARPPLWFVKNVELDIIRNNFRDLGFEAFHGGRREMLLGDGILMAIGSSTITHCGIYLGDGWMLHHPFRGKSERVLYAGMWLDRTMIVVRHPKVIQQPMTGTVNIMDLIPQHKREKLQAIYDNSLGTSRTDPTVGGDSGTTEHQPDTGN